MPRYKFDLELVGEMTWSECVMTAAEEFKDGVIIWLCEMCGTRLMLDDNHEETDDAQVFLDTGWGYVRNKKSFTARCIKCREKIRNEKKQLSRR